jgi:tripartite-type tricarboxylate transporter receptor subunit TctC
MKRLFAVLAVSTLLTTGATAQSHDDWPNRPVRVISTFAAGGTADILARIVADQLSIAFKQQFFVEVRAGAGGQIGVKTIVDSPDLYTIGIANVSHLVLHPMSRPDLGYDPKKDLANIAFVAGSPVLLSANPKSGFKGLKDFVERGKKEPLNYSSSGLGSMGHLVALNFISMTGIKAEHVPYKGASQALADLVGGHIVWSSQTVSSTASYIRAKTLDGLAVSTAKRMPDWPDLPTFKEQGFDLEASIWFGISGPAAMPPALVKKINLEIQRGLAKPEVADRMRRDGMIVDPMTPEQYAAFIDKETKVWAPVMKAAGLTVEKDKK